MVVSLNTALVSNNTPSVSFGNSRKGSAKLAPQLGDEFVAKEIKQAKNPIRRFFMALPIALGLTAAAGGGFTSCTPINPPIDPKDSTEIVTPTKMTALDSLYKDVMGPVLALDPKEAGLKDSTLVYDPTQNLNIGYKTDKTKSTADKKIVDRTVKTPTGDVVEYGTVEYTKDGKNISANFYASKNFKYKDPDKFFISTVEYAKDGISTLEGKDFKYTLQNAKESLKSFVDNPATKGIIKRLY